MVSRTRAIDEGACLPWLAAQVTGQVEVLTGNGCLVMAVCNPIVRRGRDLMDVEVFEVSLLFIIGERTVLRLEMDAWATVK